MEKKARLLIIDDEEIVLDSCTQILANHKYQLKTAENGTLGLQMIEEYQPDMVFVDLKMPGISGFEVIEKIRVFDPTIVVVVITGFASVSSAVEAMQKGAYDFLPKPFTPDELRMITRRGLEKRKLILETMQLRREKEMLRDQFAAIVSHELKSPLGAVQQNLYSLIDDLSGNLTDIQKERCARLQARIAELITLIDTWLKVLSVDINKIQENFKAVSVRTIITKAVESVQPHATRKDIELKVSIEDQSIMVYGDEGTLVESLVNIIGNAVKYSRLSSEVQVKTKSDNMDVLIAIIDKGAGIAEDDLPFIFNDFYRGKSTSATEKGGGIGLAVTRRIIDVHHGDISVDSELGKGSTFVIRLPLLAQ